MHDSQTERKSNNSKSHMKLTNTRIQSDNQSLNLTPPDLYIKSPRGSSKNLNRVLSFKQSKKELSVSPRRAEHYQNQYLTDRQDSIGPSNGSVVHDQTAARYECIASLTQQENKNLKQQNSYLLEKLRKMQQKQSRVRKLYEKAKKYKQLWQDAQVQIEALKEECEIYREQAQEMKKILLNDVHKLKQKVLETEIVRQEDSEVDHDHEGQAGKKSQIKSQASTENKSGKFSTEQSILYKYVKQK